MWIEAQRHKLSAKPEQIGFGAFGSILREAREGRLDLVALARYQDTLIPRLEKARRRVEDVELPPSLELRLGPLLKSSLDALDGLYSVLELVERYLEKECGLALNQAISLLDTIEPQFGRLGVR